MHTEEIFSEKYLKTKIKHEGKVYTNFYNDKTPKEGSHFIYLSVVLIDSVFKMVKGHCPQVSLKECEYIVTEKN